MLLKNRTSEILGGMKSCYWQSPNGNERMRTTVNNAGGTYKRTRELMFGLA